MKPDSVGLGLHCMCNILVCLSVCPPIVLLVVSVMASAVLDEGGRKAAVAVGEFLNKVRTFALDIKAKVT